MGDSGAADLPMDPAAEHIAGQDNITARFGPFALDIHDPVFGISGIGILAFVIGALMFPESSPALAGQDARAAADACAASSAGT